MNLKNTIENLILSIIIFIVGGLVGYKLSLNAVERTLDYQKDVIVEAIRKETTAINNNVTTTFDKIKSKKSEPINIIIDPTTNSVISNKDTTQIITVEEKKGFFKRIFSKK